MEKNEKVLGSWDLKVGSYSYLAVYVEREGSTDFDDKASSIQDFKLYFLGTLYNWCQVLNGSSKVSLLDFVDKILHKSFHA